MSYYSRDRHNDEDSLSAMMAKNVNASISRGSRSEATEQLQSRRRSSSLSRGLSISDHCRKDEAPLTPRRGRSFDGQASFVSTASQESSHSRSRSVVSRLRESLRKHMSDDETSVGADRSEAKKSKKKSKRNKHRSKSTGRIVHLDDTKSISPKTPKKDKQKKKTRSRSTDRDEDFEDVQSLGRRGSKKKDDKKAVKRRSRSSERIQKFEDDESHVSKTSRRRADQKKIKRRSRSSDRNEDFEDSQSVSSRISRHKRDHSKPRRTSRRKSNDSHGLLSPHGGSMHSRSSRKTEERIKKAGKQLESTSSRVKAITQPVLTEEGTAINNKLDQFFPSPESTKAKLSPSRRPRGIVNPLTSISDHSWQSSTQISSNSITKSSQTSSSRSATGSIRIMSNKAAAEQAEAALSRVAAHKEMERSTRDNLSSSFDDLGHENSPTKMGAAVGRHSRRSSSHNNHPNRRNEQYQQLHRDSGLDSVASFNSVGDGDDDVSYKSRSSFRSLGSKSIGSRLSRGGNSAGIPIRHIRMEDHQREIDDLRKQLTDALSTVEQLNGDLKREERRSDTAESDLLGLRSKLERIEDERSFLIESVRDMENAVVSKDQRLEQLESLVETQLATMEDLERKLDETEEELVKTENEMNGRKDSVREEAVKRKGSLKMQKEESRRLLFTDTDIETHLSEFRESSQNRSRLMSLVSSSSEHQSDAEELHNQLKAREFKLDEDEKNCDLREKELDAWERDLLELEDKLKRDKSKIEKERGDISEVDSKTQDSSLKEENLRLRKMQIEDKSNLKRMELENQDLRLKLDRVMKMVTNGEGTANDEQNDLADAKAQIAEKDIIIKDLKDKLETGKDNTELSNALALVEEKKETIRGLEEKIEEMVGRGPKGVVGDEDDGKNLLIRELQNQLVIAKKEATQLSSGAYVNRLKSEVRALRDNTRDLKKRMKEAEYASKTNLKKKDDSYRLLEKQMEKLKFELERRETREKNLGTDLIQTDSDLKNHIEDLEEEISHWKSTNADLENELENLKPLTNHNDENSDDDEKDDCSVASFEMSLSMSMHENLFVESSPMTVIGTPRRSSVLSIGNASRHGNETAGAMKTVTNLWSKMRNVSEHQSTN